VTAFTSSEAHRDSLFLRRGRGSVTLPAQVLDRFWTCQPTSRLSGYLPRSRQDVTRKAGAMSSTTNDRPLMSARARIVTLACAAILVANVTPSGAVDSPPRPNTGGRHLDQALRGAEGGSAVQPAPAIANNFQVVAHVPLPGRSGNGDVFYFNHGSGVGQFAYVGTTGDFCTGRGVKIVDVSDPVRPIVVARPRLRLKDVSYEDPVVTAIAGTAVLVVGVQICGERGRGGLGLFDVSQPLDPRRLSFFPTRSGGVHELDLTVLSDGRTVALLAVPFGELEGSKDFQIVDITDPRRPRRISGWGVIKDSSLPIPSVTEPPSSPGPITSCCQGIGTAFADFFFHSARGADGGRTAYVSHWDLGVLKFDVSDPSNPRLIGRTVYPFGAEGEGHSMVPYEAGGVRYILQNDEDFTSLSPARVRTSATDGKTWAVVDEPWMPTPLVDAGATSAPVLDAKRGCDASDYRRAKGKVVLSNWRASDPACGIANQIVLAARAGAEALVVNMIGRDRPAGAFSPRRKAMRRIRGSARRMPVLATGSIDGLARAVRHAPQKVTMTLEPSTPEYGFLRVFTEENPTDTDGDGILEYRQVGEFAGLPHVRGEHIRSHKQWWTIHNTEVWGNRAFSSWYAHGIVALDLTNPASPVLVGQFAPAGNVGRKLPYLSPSLPAVWGVALDPARGLIYASDVRSGLWIIRATGPAVPTMP
jgi:hypothetical protein